MFALRVSDPNPAGFWARRQEFRCHEIWCLIQHLGPPEFSMALFSKTLFHGSNSSWVLKWNPVMGSVSISVKLPKTSRWCSRPLKPKEKADYWLDISFFLPIWHKLWARNWPLGSIGITDRVTNFLTLAPVGGVKSQDDQFFSCVIWTNMSNLCQRIIITPLM